GKEAAEKLPRFPKRIALLGIEYYLFLVRDPVRRRKRSRELRNGWTKYGAQLDEAARVRGERIHIPGNELLALIDALAFGIVMELTRDPGSISPGSIARAFAALGVGLENPDAIDELVSARPNTE